MIKKYGFSVPSSNFHVLDTGPVYTATDVGSPCIFGEVFTTDGRIKSLNLTVLDDDKEFFPKYNASVSIRSEVLKAHPEIAQVLAPVMDKLNNETMIQLNAEADVQGEDWPQIARDWLERNGFVVPRT